MAELSLVILDDAGDALGQERAQLRAREIAEGFDAASLDVTIITLAKSDAEGKDAREENFVLLTVIALVIIVVLLALFYRTQSDVHITMLGLGMTILWTLGAISWLSPGGAGIVDPDNILLTPFRTHRRLRNHCQHRSHLGLDCDDQFCASRPTVVGSATGRQGKETHNPSRGRHHPRSGRRFAPRCYCRCASPDFGLERGHRHNGAGRGGSRQSQHHLCRQGLLAQGL